MQDSDFWDDNTRAQKTIEESKALKAWILPYRQIHQSIENVKALLPEVVETSDVEMLSALKEELVICDNEFYNNLRNSRKNFLSSKDI